MDGGGTKNHYYPSKPGQSYRDLRGQAKCFARFHNSSN